jgi:hypothetical protein
VREQIEPEGLYEDTMEETRPALGDEARKALEMANARRNALAPIIDKDAETAAMLPNDYQKALQRLQAARVPGASQPPPSTTIAPQTQPMSRPPIPPPDESDPAMGLAQLTRAREAANPTPASAKPASVNGTGPNRAVARPVAEADIPSAKDLAAKVARRSLASVTPPPFQPVSSPPPPIDDPAVVAHIMGTNHQPSTQSITGHTAPMIVNQMAAKAQANALAPQRTPSPIAVGGGGGLKINAERPASMPPAGFGVQKQSTPPGAAISTPPRPMNASRPPGALPRAGGGIGAVPPGSTPAKQYDFKRWSSPEINEMPTDGSPVTFEVYTAQDVANGRRPMRSLPMIEQRPKSSGIALKIFLAIVGIVIVLVTAGAVIMVSTDDPKRAPQPPTSASADPVGSVGPPPTSTSTTMVIGDPTPPPDDSAQAAPSAGTAKPPKPPKPPRQPSGGGGGGGPAAPVLPSNPYGTPGGK